MKLKTLLITVVCLCADKIYCNNVTLTPIGQAIADIKVDDVKKLIGNDKSIVDASVYVEQEEPALHYAIWKYKEEKEEPIPITFSQQMLNIFKTIKAGEIQKRLNIINLLLDNNASIDKRNQDNDGPLHIATRNNLPEVVTLLLNRGADTKLTNNEGYTPYAYINLYTVQGNKDAMKKLFDDYALKTGLKKSIQTTKKPFEDVELVFQS